MVGREVGMGPAQLVTEMDAVEIKMVGTRTQSRLLIV